MTSRPAPTRTFVARVLAAVRAIPPGRVATYGDIAELAGRPRAARAVGNILRDCRDPAAPCHRVIAAGGRLGGYGGSEAHKQHLLELEGVSLRRGRVRDFADRRWPRTRGGRHSSSLAGR